MARDKETKTMFRHSRRSPAIKLVGGIFALVGVVFVIVGCVLRETSTEQAAERTATAEATIVRVDEEVSRDSDGDITRSYYPVLSFADSDGISHQGRQSVSAGDGKYQVGEVVEIEYDPYHPEDNLVMTRDRHIEGMLVTVCLAMGAAFVVIGTLLFIVL